MMKEEKSVGIDFGVGWAEDENGDHDDKKMRGRGEEREEERDLERDLERERERENTRWGQWLGGKGKGGEGR